MALGLPMGGVCCPYDVLDVRTRVGPEGDSQAAACEPTVGDGEISWQGSFVFEAPISTCIHSMQGSVVGGAALWAAVASALASKSGIDLWGPLILLSHQQGAAGGLSGGTADVLLAAATTSAAVGGVGDGNGAAAVATQSLALRDSVLGGILGSHPSWDKPDQWAQLLITVALSPAGERAEVVP